MTEVVDAGRRAGAADLRPAAGPQPPVKMCHVITRLIVGGAQENTLLTCALLDRARYAPLLVSGPQTGPEGDLRGEAARLAVPTRIVSTLVRQPAPPRDLASALRLWRLFARERPVIVHTHSSKAGIVGRLAARWARVPVVVHTVHGWGFHARTPPVRRATYVGLERLAARWTDRLVVVSERDREKGLREAIGSQGQYVLIRSGIDLAPYRDAARHRATIRESLGIPPAAFVLGAVTRLAPQKDPLTLVRAAADVLRRRPDTYLLLVGDGPLRGELERLAASLGVLGRVRLTGIRRDVPALMGAFDVFLLTSLWEGLPRVIPQAMAAGVPIVATGVDGIGEAVEDGVTGLLAPPGSPARLAERVLEIVTAPERGRALALRASARTGEFELATMLRRLDALYTELLRPLPGAAPTGPGR
jgi:glycosyltransferase involved in cell wall biosynthesis